MLVDKNPLNPKSFITGNRKTLMILKKKKQKKTTKKTHHILKH